MSITVFPANPAILKWARESIGLSLEEVAKKTKIKIEKLIDWEDGKSNPSYPQIKKISKIYKRSTASFLLVVVPTEPNLPKDFRVVSDSEIKTLSADVRLAIRRARLKREQAIEMFNLLEIEIQPFEYKATLSDSPIILAEEWRRKLDIDIPKQKKFKDKYAALNAWKEAFEKLDLLVFQASMSEGNDLRGVTLFNEVLPVILLNTKDDPLPRIFSLFHEFCHVLLHVSGIGNMSFNIDNDVRENKIEIFCNSFAGNFLVPAEDLLHEVKKLSGDITSKINILSKKYQISREVICRRMYEVKLISNEQYNDSIRQLRKNSFKAKKAGPVLPDIKSISGNGVKFTKLVFENFNEGNISIRETLKYLGIKSKYLSSCQEILNRRSHDVYL